MKWYKIYVVRFLVIKSISGAEVSKTFRHWCRSVQVSCGHFGTSAEMSWVRSVLGLKCPYTQNATTVFANLRIVKRAQ